MKTYSQTDTGVRRETNQDSLFTSDTPVGNLPNLYIVADGMGGHKAGEYASKYTVDRVVASVSRSNETEPDKILEAAIQKANELLLDESRSDTDKNGMGTTIVAATIIGDRLHVANVGDSRLYVIGTKITQITRDHSLVNEMVRIGEIAAADAKGHPDKNVITRAIGVTEKVNVDFFETKLKKGDFILLCSDGLTNMVDDNEIRRIVMSQRDVVEQVQRLIEEANQNGGQDNISVIVIKPFADEVKE